MYSYYGLFSAFSIFYTLVLLVLFIGKGFGQIIWPIILFVATYNEFDVNEVAGIYVINETVPMWVFHPLNFLGGLILALIIYVFIVLDFD